MKVIEKQIGFNKLKQNEQAELLHVTFMRSSPFVGSHFNKTSDLHFVCRLRKDTHVVDQKKWKNCKLEAQDNKKSRMQLNRKRKMNVVLMFREAVDKRVASGMQTEDAGTDVFGDLLQANLQKPPGCVGNGES